MYEWSFKHQSVYEDADIFVGLRVFQDFQLGLFQPDNYSVKEIHEFRLAQIAQNNIQQQKADEMRKKAKGMKR